MEEPIKINNNLKDTSVELWNPTDKLIGLLENEIVFNDIRIQIKEKQLSGYYIMFDNKRIDIGRNGNLQHWPKGLFDRNLDLLMELI